MDAQPLKDRADGNRHCTNSMQINARSKLTSRCIREHKDEGRRLVLLLNPTGRRRAAKKDLRYNLENGWGGVV